MKRQITVWHDAASGERPAWIVSLDRVWEIGGGAVRTDTLHVEAEYSDALAAGEREAAERGLPLVSQDERTGQSSILRAAREAAERSES